MDKEWFTIFSRSMVARLMVPVGLMLALVCLLGLVTIATRSRLRDAAAAVAQAQDTRLALIEARSLSRSLQRDALALLIERDAAERATIRTKFAHRSRQLTHEIHRLETDDALQDDRRASYFATQRIVLRQIGAVIGDIDRGRADQALHTFQLRVRPAERRASTIADRLIDDQGVAVTAGLAGVAALQADATWIVAMASVALLLMAGGATLAIIRRTVVLPLIDIQDAMERIAGGDAVRATPHADRSDEIGRMARAIEAFRRSVLARERHEAEEAAKRTDLIQRELAATQAAAARDRALAQAATVLERETGTILVRLRDSARHLTGTAADLGDHSAAATRDLAEVNAAVSRAAVGAVDIAAATGQFMGALDQAAERTRSSARLGSEAASEAMLLVERMNQVQEDAGTVTSVIDLVGGIARQTKLVALNAGIEASRAGAAGAGFAVVAAEVKSLAGQSAHALDEISDRIAAMQRVVREAGDGMVRIGTIISDAARDAAGLVAVMHEQADNGRVISRNVTGTATDLDGIGVRALQIEAVATGVDELAARVGSDSQLVEESAEILGVALNAFFAKLHG